MSEIRDGHVSVTNLAIRVAKQDACPVVISEGTRLAAQNMEAFFARHPTPPATSNEQIAPPDVEAVAPVMVTPDLLHAANTPLAATLQADSVEKDHQADRPNRKITLAVAATLLILLAVLMMSGPLSPGRDGVRDRLSLVDHFSRWGQQFAALQEKSGIADVDGEMQAQPEEAAVGVINRHQAKAKVPRSTLEVPVRETTVAGIVGQTDIMQAERVEKLLAQGQQALDDYRLVTPEGDNAYEYLHAVLQLDPANVKARAGIQEIVDIYITLAAKAVDSNEIARAGRYLDRGLDIQSDNPELLALKDSVNRRMESATVTHETARAGQQLTRNNTPLQKQPLLMKRQAAERRREVSAATDQDI